ncbi:assimilatory nitrite reductase (NAD(P)H) large subunit precursor [Yoonia tamlensis]|uniref:Assimilatory nitrite reductase (NAD(P)H) large subunit n=1 Tax=Yoonia tamlensis TaxID=390270 RepID=A0A1I6FVN8_9RHOB|nr:nitrite reductase large subunit NirB [Yoonia tamlensis]SFR33994.1 assimilatory nitrite reductase (NAD(P)H) large subunit precursor [Yoonia tamlensis]
MTQKLIIIGAGMASGRALEQLLEADPNAYDVTLFNAEPRGNYNRIMLSPVLSGEKTYDEIVTHSAEWYEANGVTCRFGERVANVDRARKVVVAENGDELPYDKLLFGTGSNPFIIPMPGHDLEGVIAYRDLEDTELMMSMNDSNKVVVIGGGLLGLEAAAGMAARGVDVTVVHIMGHLMERQLDEAAGYLLRKALVDKGITVRCQANSKQILGENGKVRALQLDDGTELPCDLLVMAVGIRPNVKLAQDVGLAVGKGIHVDDQMLTSDADILAVGECVEHDGAIFGLVAPLYDQAKVAAQTLLNEHATFVQKEISTKLKVTGCDLFSAGDFAEGEDREDIVFRDPARGVYRRLVLKDNKIIGAVMYGDTADSNWFFGMIKDGTDIADMRETLIFGPAYQGGTPMDPLAAVAALPDDAEICGCNGISKGQIVAAINAGANTLDAVKATSKAGSSCGSCVGLVTQVLGITLGDEFKMPEKETVCKCTDQSHDDVRKLIIAKQLKSIPQIMQELDWNSPGGCHVCRPALNYYLVCAWPGEEVDDGKSRFINERVHANIQKDGTYSVVPRMLGGITTPNELRAIADAADKFNVPTVKVTGGQRIDLLGVKKEDLPAIWYDLGEAGMMSGQAYAKGLRTVKTCVGTDHCRFGTQDSTGLGIKIESEMWGAWSPHKFKLAVTGCPRNCAEATCKDLGIICVDSGYQILVGGAAGLDLLEAELLITVKTEQEAIDVSCAFYQLYREGAQYLHRPYKWIAKVGLDWVKEQVADDLENRAALAERFRYSQQFYQVDPWAERARKGVDAHEFTPLADFTKVAAE